MVRVALRVYNNEIGDLIDHGQIEEAIAHCRHILETHPKHVDTYRLLGKAYLEEQRYSDAVDILQRVLSSAPEDFTAHVGMSIIREGEENLDSALYHMEHAFETQPSNHAIQDELRRLFGRRDGLEPHKIRLTRGALARMYAHGNLYEQAIAELLAALSEDPQRYELQVLLATMYYQSGKKVEAAETCSKIVEKLPFCLEANRLLSIILRESGREEDAQGFYQRWVELDPYAAHLSDHLTPIDQLQDQVVTVERLEWEPSGGGLQPAEQPAWSSSSGVSSDDEDRGKQGIPDWLSPAGDDSTKDAAPAPSEPLPDWVGSGPTDSGADQNAAPVGIEFPQTSGDALGEDLYSGDAVPTPAAEAESSTDWMAALDGDTDSSGNGDWMAGIDGQEDAEALQPAASDEEQPDWMTLPDESDAGELASTGAPDDDQPDFLDTFNAETPQPAVASGGEDDWIASLQADTAGGEPGSEEQPDFLSLGIEAGEPASAGFETAGDGDEIPDFLKDSGWNPSSDEVEVPSSFTDSTSLEEAETPQADIPDWMQKLAPTEGDAAPPNDAGGFTAVQSEADPDWLQSIQSQEGSDSPDWLDEFGQGSSADAETLPPSASSEDADFPAPPDWQTQPAGGSDDLSTALGAPAQGDDDAALDWLTDPSAQAAQEAVPEAGAAEPPAEDPLAALTQPDETPAQATGDTEEWLTSLGGDAQPSAEAAGDAIDFLSALDDPPAQGDDDASFDWLADLSAEAAQEAAPEAGAAETPAEDPLAALAQPDEAPAQTTGDTEEWLTSLGGDAQPSPEAAGDAGDFLSALDDPAAQSAEDASLDWLTDLSAEAAQEAAPEAGAAETPAEDPLAALTQPEETPAQATGDTEEWLTSLGGDAQPSPEAAGDADDILSALDAPPDQGDEDTSLDWLADLSAEAAQEAAPEAGVAETPAEDPLAALTQPEKTPAQATGDTEEWLTSLGGDAQPSPEAAGDGGDFLSALDDPSAQSDEDASPDWLADLSAEAAQEAAPETALEAGAAETPAEDPLAALTQPEETPAQAAGDSEDWLTSLRQDEGTAWEEPAPDWVNDEQQAAPAADTLTDADDFLPSHGGDQPEPTSVQTPDTGASLEEDEGLAWLESLAAKQGVAEEELITSHDDRPADTPEWAQQIGDGVPTLQEAEAIPADQTGEAGDISEDVDASAEGDGDASLAWLDDISAEASQEASSEDEQKWLDSLRDFDAGQSTEAEIPTTEAPVQDSLPLPYVEDQDDKISGMVPDLIQDVIGETPDPNGITKGDEPLPGPDITPTLAEEWLPESEIKDDLPIEPEPAKSAAPTPQPRSKKKKTKTKTPAKTTKITPEDMIADARQEMRGGNLDQAIDQYSKLIQKGKLVEDVIADIEEALRKHPINVGLWQLLGDAYMRLDRLQDALDSYSKAEDLLT